MLCGTAISSGDCPLWIKSGLGLGRRHIRFTPKSGHRNSVVKCPLCANSRHSKAVWISIGCKGRQRWRTDGSFGWQLLELPNWVAVTWMIVWAFLGYIFAPYRMWKHHRKQIASSSQVDKK